MGGIKSTVKKKSYHPKNIINYISQKNFQTISYCNEEVNQYECRSLEDVEKFKKNFNKGVYKECLNA